MLLACCHQPCWAIGHCPDEGCVTIRPQDRVMLISSRPVGCATSPERLETDLYAEEFLDSTGDGHRQWVSVPWRSLTSSLDVTQPLLVYTHGNRVNWRDTHRRGLYVYKRLTRCATDARPIQYLIFAWHADELKKPMQDYRVKAARTGPVGKQLGYVLAALPPSTRLGAIGYSYGARVTSGALHQLASGACQSPLQSIRAVYLAAAFDAHWLARGQCHGHAMEVTDCLLLTSNRNDPAMKFYRFLARNYNPQALGFAGPTGLDRERARRVRIVNTTNSVGRSHDLCDYVRAPGFMSKAYRLLSYADQPESNLTTSARAVSLDQPVQSCNASPAAPM